MACIMVLGMGRSGVGAARLALRLGADVVCVDDRPAAPVIPGTQAHYGPPTPSLQAVDQLVVSPGVPPSHPVIVEAQQRGVGVVSELGYAAAQLTVPLVAVTGTNGKSTTVHLLAQLLQGVGQQVFVGGNYGRPLSEAVGGSYDTLVVEVSSYQLEHPGSFEPQAAALLNLQPDHLERHGTLAAYAATKIRIAENMPRDSVLVVGPAEVPWPIAEVKSTVLHLGGAPGVLFEDDNLRLVGTADDGLIDASGFPLLGRHNLHNLAAAVVLAVTMGAPREGLSTTNLRGLEHRLEGLKGPRGTTWVNDSKATNVDSVLVALEAVPDAWVLLGGRGKAGTDYGRIAPLLEAQRAICFGESASEILEHLPGGTGVPSLEDAVDLAFQQVSDGGVVLLSPGCASFDAYANFEERGRHFKQLVGSLS